MAHATARTAGVARQVELTLTTPVPSKAGPVPERVVVTGAEARWLECALTWRATPNGGVTAGRVGRGKGARAMDDSLHPEVGAALATVEVLREALLAYAERRDEAGHIRDRPVDELARALDVGLPALARLQRRLAALQRRAS